MNWSLFLQITIPICGLIAWAWSRLDKKFDAQDKKFDIQDKKFDTLIENITDIKKDIRSIDSRLSRLEGRFEERTYWESRQTGTDKNIQGKR